MANKSQVTRSRALATEDSSIGDLRHQLYKRAIEQIEKAKDQGFYLEAIALIESLIADRLESRYSYLGKMDFSFKSLGVLIGMSRKLEQDAILKELVQGKLDQWRESRNQALHAMVKLEVTDPNPSWEIRTQRLPSIVDDGMKIFRGIDKRCGQLRE